MGNFQTKMALLVFSLVFAGCTTPFVEVTVTGSPSNGSGGDCFWPCMNGGGATFETDGGQEARVILVEKSQDVFHLQGASAETIRLVVPSGSAPTIGVGDIAIITKVGTQWVIKKK